MKRIEWGHFERERGGEIYRGTEIETEGGRERQTEGERQGMPKA